MSSILPRELLSLLWNWYGIYILLMRCERHLMTASVRVKPMGISRCWTNGKFWTNLIYAWRTVVFFSVSPHSPSPFSHSFQTALRSHIDGRPRSQKIRLFCSLVWGPRFDRWSLIHALSTHFITFYYFGANVYWNMFIKEIIVLFNALLNPFWNHWLSLQSDWLSEVRFINESHHFLL